MSLANQIAQQLNNIDRKEAEAEAERVRHAERVNTMRKIAEAISEEVGKNLNGVSMEVHDEEDVAVWTFTFESRTVTITSQEVLNIYDPEDSKNAYFRDIMERLIVGKLANIARSI